VSLLENAVYLGLPIPAKLLGVLKQSKPKTNQTESRENNDE
jgi:phage-related holin